MISFPLCLTCESTDPNKLANLSGYCSEHQPEGWVDPTFKTFEEECLYHMTQRVNPDQKYMVLSKMTFPPLASLPKIG